MIDTKEMQEKIRDLLERLDSVDNKDRVYEIKDFIRENEESKEFLASIHSSIKTTTYDGKKCYYISSNPKKYYFFENNIHIDKDTGLVINAGACETIYIDGHIDRAPATDYIYEFNTVTEDDFIEPDISEYEIKQ